MAAMKKNMKVRMARWPGDKSLSLKGAVLTLDGQTYHRHPNGGGWVADTARVAATAFVGFFARVYGDAQVFDNAPKGTP
jgi:hypothetical protein